MSATDNAAPITAPASAGDSIDDTPSATAAAGESQLRITASDIFNLLWTKLGYYTQWYLQPLLLLAFLALPIWLVDYEISCK